MKQEIQTTIFDYRPPLVIPDFGGDFEKEMDWIKSLSEKDWLRLFEEEKL